MLDIKPMYYNRKLSDSFSRLIEPGGELRWLFDFVKNQEDLDFQIGRNNAQEWISVYRGLSRIITIQPRKEKIVIDGANTYKDIAKSKNINLYGLKNPGNNFSVDFEAMLTIVRNDKNLEAYYDCRKEGFYQNEFSRKFGITGNKDSDFVIIDKEAVIGYSGGTPEKEKEFLPLQISYRELFGAISKNDSKRYGQNLQNKSLGNELDFLALDKEGNILLIEYKDGSNTSGIYRSPIQIGLYYDIFKRYPRFDLENAVNNMFLQKQKIGLIDPSWVKPDKIMSIIPWLVISNYKEKSVGKENFNEVRNIAREFKNDPQFLSDLRIFNHSISQGIHILKPLFW